MGPWCGAEDDRICTELMVCPVGIGIMIAGDHENRARGDGLDELADEIMLTVEVRVAVEEVTDDQDCVGASVAGDIEDEGERACSLRSIVTEVDVRGL